MKQIHESVYGTFDFRRLSVEDVFGEPTSEFYRAFAQITNKVFLNENGTLVDHGDLFSVYILKRGKAEVTFFNQLVSTQDARILGINEIVGLGETISNSYSMVRIHSVSPCLFHKVTRHDLLNLLTDNPKLCMKILSKLSEIVNESHSSVKSLIS